MLAQVPSGPSEEQVQTFWQALAQAFEDSSCPWLFVLHIAALAVFLWLAVFRRGGLNWHDRAMGRKGRK